MKLRASFFYAVLTPLVLLVACNGDPEPAPTLNVDFPGAGGGTVVLSAPSSDAAFGEAFSETFPSGERVDLTATPDADSVFAGWSGDCDDATAAACRLVMNADKQVSATFAKKTYTLTLLSEGTGSGQTLVTDGDGKKTACQAKCELRFPAGTSVTLTADPGAGATFTGWGQACATTATTCRLTLDTDKTVTAVFDRVGASSFDLSVTKTGNGAVTSSPAGINCGADCSETYLKNTVVTLRATPAAGSTFAGWQGDCAGTGACSVTMSESKTVTALFQTDNAPTLYTLSVAKTGGGNGTVSSTPVGIDCGSDCSEAFAAGTTVTLNARTNRGSAFTGWQGCLEVSGDVCRVTLNAAVQVKAVFSVSGQVKTVSAPVRATDPNNGRVSTDDAEQFLQKPANNALPAGATDTTGGDLDLGYDTRYRTQQLVGLRFRNLAIPQGATIESAYIQFKSDEDYAHTTHPKLTLRAEANPNAPTFVNGAVNNISDRTLTVAQVQWQPPLWGDEKSAGEAERSPDLFALVQEVVNLPGWSTSSALVFVVSGEPGGTAHRAATSREDVDGPAQLFVTYRY